MMISESRGRRAGDASEAVRRSFLAGDERRRHLVFVEDVVHLVVEADVAIRVDCRDVVAHLRDARADLHAVERPGAAMVAARVSEDSEHVARHGPVDRLARLRAAARDREHACRVDHKPVVSVRLRRADRLRRGAVEPELGAAVVLQDEQILVAAPALAEEGRVVGQGGAGSEAEVHAPVVRCGSAGVDPLRAGGGDGRELLRHVDAELLHEEEAHGASVAKSGRDFVRVGGLAEGDVGDLLERVPCVLVLAAVSRAVRDVQLLFEVVVYRERDGRLRLIRHAHRAGMRSERNAKACRNGDCGLHSCFHAHSPVISR